MGGTSTDISAVVNGRVMVDYAEVGGHKTYVNSLDVRTVGIAGGSMVRFDGKALVEAGPRSAHVAGLHYTVFSDPAELQDLKLVTIQPRPKDPADYVAVENRDGKRFAITIACAANLLGLVQPDHYAYGNPEGHCAADPAAGAGADPGAAGRRCGQVDGTGTWCRPVPGRHRNAGIFAGLVEHRRFFGLLKSLKKPLRVVDREGVIRLQQPSGSAATSVVGRLEKDLNRLLTERSKYGDAGIEMPNTFVLCGGRIVDLSGLVTPEQVASLAAAELGGVSPDEPVAILFGDRA